MGAVASLSPKPLMLEQFASGDAPTESGGLAPQPIDPAVEQARLIGFEEGRRAGVEEGRAAERAAFDLELEQAVATAVAETKAGAQDAATSALTAALTNWETARVEAAAQIEETAMRAMVAALRAVTQRAAIDGLAEEVARGVAERLSRSASEGRGCITAPAEALDAIKAAVAERLGSDAPWDVEIDPELPSGAARAEWRDGFASFDLAAAAREACAAAERAFTLNAGAAPAEMETNQ